MLDLIYLNYNSTTPIDVRVRTSMLPYLNQEFGNEASDAHLYARQSGNVLKSSKEKIAKFLGCEPEEIYFTSGSKESINFIFKSIIEKYSYKGKHIITAKTEHKAVLDICHYLEEKKYAELTFLNVDMEGNIDLNELQKSIRKDTVLVSLMHANNETGVIHPVEEIAEICKRNGVTFFSDTTQSAGKLRTDVNEIGFDAACISAHKMYGPKGVGAFFLSRKNSAIIPSTLINEATEDVGFKSGTLNLPCIVGLARACEIANEDMWDDNMRVSKLRGKFEHQILDFCGVRIVGGTRNRLYNTSNICFAGKSSTDLSNQLHHFAVSFSSSSRTIENNPSHVLTAMGINEDELNSCIRFSFGKYTTDVEIESLIQTIKKIYQNE